MDKFLTSKKYIYIIRSVCVILKMLVFSREVVLLKKISVLNCKLLLFFINIALNRNKVIYIQD